MLVAFRKHETNQPAEELVYMTPSFVCTRTSTHNHFALILLGFSSYQCGIYCYSQMVQTPNIIQHPLNLVCVIRCGCFSGVCCCC